MLWKISVTRSIAANHARSQASCHPRGPPLAAQLQRVPESVPTAADASVGCTRSVALVSRGGSIDWLCWPRFDSPSIFGRLLDVDKGGFFAIHPAVDHHGRRRYLDETNVIETTFTTSSGTARLLDLMPVMTEAEKRATLSPFRQLLRRIEVV